MGYSVKQSSTTVAIVFGPVVLSSDHISAATGKTLTVTISKNGGSFASPSGSVTEIANGYYQIAGNSTDNGTLGPLVVNATGTGCDPFNDTFAVVTYDPFSTTNGLISSGTGTGQLSVSSGVASANATQINGVSTSSVTTVNANVGTTQPTNYSGTGSSAYVRSDIEAVGGTAYNVNSAQFGANVVGVVGSSIVQSSGVINAIRSAAAQAGASTTITLDSGASATDSLYNDAILCIYSGTGAGQSRLITGYVGSTKVATVDHAWTTTPDNSSIYAIFPGARSDLGLILGTASAGAAGYVGPDWGHVNAPTSTVNLSGTTVGTLTTYTGNTPQSGDVFGALPTHFSSFSIDASGRIDVGKILGTASQGAAGYAGVDWSKLTNVTSTVDFTNTTIKNLDGNTVQTGDAYARLGAPAGASVSADVAAVKSDTGTVLTDVNTGAGAIYSRLGAPAGASIAADIASVKTDTAHLSSECISSSISSGTPAAGSFIGASGLSSTDNFYQGCMLAFTSGTLKGIARAISSYTGSTKTFSFTGATGAIDAPFPTAPSTSDTFDILGRGASGT